VNDPEADVRGLNLSSSFRPMNQKQSGFLGEDEADEGSNNCEND
jgi:hypothetical protein